MAMGYIDHGPALSPIRRLLDKLRYEGHDTPYFDIICFSHARVYPHSISGVGTRSYYLYCTACKRSKRTFYHEQFNTPNDHQCSLCNWKKANHTLSHLVIYRLWPAQLTTECNMHMAAFLCTEGYLELFYVASDLHVITASTIQMFELAHQHSWHSVLLTGYRTAAIRALNGYLYGPDSYVNRISLPLARVWYVVQMLCQNPFWKLLVTGCPTPARPLKIALEFLGPMGIEPSKRSIFIGTRRVMIEGPHLEHPLAPLLKPW